MPVSPCSGSWAPTYDASGCQSGWQCIPAAPGGGGGSLPDPTISEPSFLDTLFNFQSPEIQRIPDIQSVNESVLGATASVVPHTEGELFTSAPTVKQDMLTNGGVSFTETTFVGRTFSADQGTMDRVCTVLHGAGSTATNIGARGYSSCGNNQNFQFSAGRWSVVSGCSYAHISGAFSCLVPAPAPTPGQCTLSVSPSVVQAGQSAILSWVATNLSSLTITPGIGAVTPVTSGTRVVTPSGTVTYSGSGVSSDSSTNYSIQSAHSSIISVMALDTAKYGIAYNTSYGIYADPTTITHICELVFGPGAVQQQYDVTAFNSCGNNQILKWDGTRWTAFGACQDNRKMLYVLDCQVPQVSTAPPVQCGGNATITVVPKAVAEPRVIEVDCDNSVTIRVPQCRDGIDNDGDGSIDNADDPGCTNDDDDDEGGDETQCSDGIDNADPEDTRVDMNDPGCSSPQDDDETDVRSPQCSDGRDNDGDGLADEEDPDCYTGGGGGGGGGGGSYNPNGGSESGGGGAPQCSDGIDNNGDGNVDFPDDPGCSSANDASEFIEQGDITLEADPPLVKKNQSCTLTLSARNVSSCSLTGPGVSRGFTATGGIVSVKEVVTPTLTQSSTFTLSCNALDGKKVSKSVNCKIAPTFEEF